MKLVNESISHNLGVKLGEASTLRRDAERRLEALRAQVFNAEVLVAALEDVEREAMEALVKACTGEES